MNRVPPGPAPDVIKRRERLSDQPPGGKEWTDNSPASDLIGSLLIDRLDKERSPDNHDHDYEKHDHERHCTSSLAI